MNNTAHDQAKVLKLLLFTFMVGGQIVVYQIGPFVLKATLCQSPWNCDL